MTHASNPRMSRRRLLELGGGLTAGALGAGALIQTLRAPGSAAAHGGESAANIPSAVKTQVALAGTDGWAYIPGPGQTGIDGKVYFPDDMARAPQNLYCYGFRDVTAAHLEWVAAAKIDPTSSDADAARQKIYRLKGLTQTSSYIMSYDEGDQVEITLYNLGWAQRPDIPDGHTVHWHGFKNATPWFDGVPEMSGAAPINKTFTYFYDCQVPGTYMYHCHWEDVEHIQLGMTGSVWIRPKQNSNVTFPSAATFAGAVAGLPIRYVYNDGVQPTDPRSTYYNREFSFMLMDYDLQQHQKLSHIQQPDWSEFHADAWTINGRSYPDSIKPNAVLEVGIDLGSGSGTMAAPVADPIVLGVPATSQAVITPAVAPLPIWVDNMLVGTTANVGGVPFTVSANTGTTFTIQGGSPSFPAVGSVSYSLLDTQLAYQPYTSLITCNPGERVLLRIACLGYQDHSLQMDGIPLTVVGRDADWLENNVYTTDTIDVSPGESYDATFIAPAHSTGNAVDGPDIYMFYDRDFANDGSGGGTVYTGIATQVRVYPAGTVAAQRIAIPNDLGI